MKPSAPQALCEAALTDNSFVDKAFRPLALFGSLVILVKIAPREGAPFLQQTADADCDCDAAGRRVADVHA